MEQLDMILDHETEAAAATESTPPAGRIGLKSIKFPSPFDVTGKTYYPVTIALQSENGPCPLIAIANVLSLRREIELQADSSNSISNEDLTSIIANYLISPKGNNSPIAAATTPTTATDGEKNLEDVLAILPQLQTGLDMNLLFSGPKNFELTPGLLLFDMLRIPLVHGWLPDPSSPVFPYLSNLSYNSAMDQIIKLDNSPNSKDDEDSLKLICLREFFDTYPNQLTEYGLSILTQENIIDPGALGILFRNNHFSVIYRKPLDDDGSFLLLQLVTDSGFADVPEVVWESLESIRGESTFWGFEVAAKEEFVATEEGGGQPEMFGDGMEDNNGYLDQPITSGEGDNQLGSGKKKTSCIVM